MTDITEFCNLVAVDVYPCPDPLIRREVISALIEFCDKSWVLSDTWNHVFVPANIDASLINSYDIDFTSVVTSAVKPAAIRALHIDGTPWPVKRKNILNALPDWDAIKEVAVKYYNLPDSSTIRLFDMDDSIVNILLRVAFKPLRSVTQVDDVLFDDWSEAIVARAKSTLLNMPSKEWTNPAAAALAERDWRRVLSRAKAEAEAEGSNQSQTVVWQSFGNID